MTNPISSLDTASIVALAFGKFVESGAGEIAKDLTAKTIQQLDALRKTIWAKLSGRADIEEIKGSLKTGTHITQDQMRELTTHLQTAMDNDPSLAEDICMLANTIRAEISSHDNRMVQKNYDHAKGWQTKVEGSIAYIGEVRIDKRHSQ